jgi:hypothetical protein
MRLRWHYCRHIDTVGKTATAAATEAKPAKKEKKKKAKKKEAAGC